MLQIMSGDLWVVYRVGLVSNIIWYCQLYIILQQYIVYSQFHIQAHQEDQMNTTPTEHGTGNKLGDLITSLSKSNKLHDTNKFKHNPPIYSTYNEIHTLIHRIQHTTSLLQGQCTPTTFSPMLPTRIPRNLRTSNRKLPISSDNY